MQWRKPPSFFRELREEITNDKGKDALLVACYLWCEQVYGLSGLYINHQDNEYLRSVAKRLHVAVELF